MTEARVGISNAWKKSSWSASGSCVEVRRSAHGVQVRDSKDESGPVLQFTVQEWLAFLGGVRLGEFEILEPLTEPL